MQTTTPENGKGRRAGNTPTPMQTSGDPTASAGPEQPLIEIQDRKVGAEDRAVSARALHRGLGVGRDFSNWFKAQVKRGGFVEGEDFVLLAQKGEQTGSGGHNRVDFAMTLDAGKHIALMSRTPKGREVRAYFIAVEKQVRATRTGISVSAAERLGKLERDLELINQNGSNAGRYLGSLRRRREVNDAERAPLKAILQPQLPGLDEVEVRP